MTVEVQEESIKKPRRGVMILAQAAGLGIISGMIFRQSKAAKEGMSRYRRAQKAAMRKYYVTRICHW